MKYLMGKRVLFLCAVLVSLLTTGCDKHDYCENTKLYVVKNESHDTVYYSLKGFDELVRISPGYSRNFLPIYSSVSDDGPDIDIQVSDIIGSFDYLQVVYVEVDGRRFYDTKGRGGAMVNPDSYRELRGSDIDRYVDKPLQKEYTQFYIFIIDDEYLAGLMEVK